ncbi:hypothetical protein E2P81_ATG10184 [Venturia nashicola]|nr:hypothetical protein E2P81_ATG10184 [Venturia nashicola]
MQLSVIARALCAGLHLSEHFACGLFGHMLHSGQVDRRPMPNSQTQVIPDDFDSDMPRIAATVTAMLHH